MVFLHVHERRVVIRLAVAVPIPADVDVPGIALVLLDPSLHRLNGPLDGRLALAAAVDEFYPLRPLLRVQLLADLLQVPDGDLFGQTVLYPRFCQQPGQLLRHLRIQLLPLLLGALLPDKRVLVRVRLDLRPVDEHVCHVYETGPYQQLHHLSQQILADLAAQYTRTEPRQRVVVRRLVPLQQIHESQILPTGRFHSPRVYHSPHVPVDPYLRQEPCGILVSPQSGVRRVDPPVVNSVHDGAEQSHRVILWNAHIAFQ